MNNTFRVSSLLRQKLLDLTVSPEAVLRHAGLPLGLFDQEKICVSTEELFALWDAIAAVSGDPGIGLKIGGEERIERYDPIAIASLYTRTFRDAVERAARYKQLVCPEAIRLVAQGEECAVRFSWLLAKQTEPPLLTDVCFAWIHGIGRRGTGGAVTPVRVEFQRPLAHRELYEAHFGCPVRFKAAHNALIFRKADIERPFLTHNAEMLAMIAPQLESELACRQAQPSAADQVKAALKRVLAGKRPEIRAIAKELGQSARTLQRRLAEQGETYQSVLEAARRELARHYLLHSSLELNETAYLLGYEDANSFFRAFQKWEGMPPGRWRSGSR